MAQAALNFKTKYSYEYVAEALRQFGRAANLMQSDYDGRMQIVVHRGNKWYPAGNIESTKLIDEIISRGQGYGGIINTDADVYITANEFLPTTTRKKETLFAYTHIVIDCDLWHDFDRADRSKVLEQFDHIMKNDVLKRAEMFAPNFYTKTGRGVQLWFNIEHLSAKCSKSMQIVIKRIIEQYEALFDEYEELCGFSVDIGASKKLSGLFRLPFSYNTKADQWGSIVYLHEDIIDVLKVCDDICKADREHYRAINKIEYEKRAKQKEKYERVFTQEQINGRSGQIYGLVTKLIEIRKATGRDIQRKRMLFMVYGSASEAYGVEKAWSTIENVNSMFPVPLDMEELKVRMLNAKQKALSGESYIFSNRYILEELEISEEEAELCGFMQAQDSKTNTARKARADRKKAKAKRDKQIIKLYKEGHSQKEVAALLDVPKSTVNDVLARNSIRKTDTIENDVYKAAESGKSTKEIAKEVECCEATARKYLNIIEEVSERLENAEIMTADSEEKIEIVESVKNPKNSYNYVFSSPQGLLGEYIYSVCSFAILWALVRPPTPPGAS